MAMKGYERLRSKHVECSLLTGQEAEKTAADTHVSCTMEMANLSKIYEVSVEIQTNYSSVKWSGDPSGWRD